MKSFKKIRLLWIIPVLIILFFISFPIVNDITASNVAKKVWSTPIPQNTEKVEKISRAGKLVGSGNGMQYFGAILLKSSCSLEEIKAHYSKYSNDEWEYFVERQTINKVDIIEHRDLYFDSAIEGNEYYIVY